MKRKKIFSIVMALVLSLCSFPLMEVQAEEAFPEIETLEKNRTEELEKSVQEITPQAGNVRTVNNIWEEYRYRELEDGTLEITGYKGNDTELVIPAEINGKRVTGIGYEAFCNCRSLTSIELPAGLTSIWGDAFSGCSSLTSIELPAGLTSIEFGAFSGCSSLTSIELPAGLTSIDQDAFSGCSSLTSIELPASLTSIEFGAFSGCSSLTSIELPASLTSIEFGAFSGCSNLKEIMVDSNNPAYTSQDGILYDKNKEELICYPGGKTGNITILESVTSIGSYAFRECGSLTSIELPAGLTSIEFSAFSGCSNLTSIELPAGLTSIWFGAFSGCSSLKEIMVDSNNPAYMSQDGILYDKNKKELICCPGGKTGNITILEGMTSIGQDAFSGCSSLTSIELPAGLTSIRYWAFSGCSSLTSIELPASLTSIDDDVFSGCNSLKEIMVDSNNPAYTSQDGILYDENKKELICCPGGKTGNITILESVTRIGSSAFRECGSLTSIELPAGLTSIGSSAFRECGSLTSIKLPEGLTSIGEDAFWGCSSLTSIKLPEGLTSIEFGAFSGCSSLTEIKLPASITSIEYDSFDNCVGLVLLVYKGSYAETYAKKYGLNYKYIDDIDNCSHTLNTTIVKATTKKNGSITKTCTECGEQTTEIIYAVKNIKLSQTSYTYNGKSKKPYVTVKDSKGKALKNKTDYTVTYPKNMKNVGSYTITIKLKGNYKGTVKKTFQIIPKGTSISEITPKKKGFALEWNKQAVQTTGYEVAYSTNKKFTKKTTGTITVGKSKIVSKSVSKLKAKKKYYVKIRTYKAVKINGKAKKLYSAWSKIKTVITKR